MEEYIKKVFKENNEKFILKIIESQCARSTDKNSANKILYVLKKRFSINCEKETLSKIGKQFNLSSERIRNLEAKGMKILKNIERLKTYL